MADGLEFGGCVVGGWKVAGELAVVAEEELCVERTQFGGTDRAKYGTAVCSSGDLGEAANLRRPRSPFSGQVVGRLHCQPSPRRPHPGLL